MKRINNSRLSFLPLCCLLLMWTASHAQIPKALEIPLQSQKASVMQRIGFTDITINYHSPAVKGRELWGKFVQYGQVWRAGANENTTIRFTHDVKIDGQPLAAGEYGLHMIPTAEEWTVIFSNNNYSWGSFFYKEAEDALRVKVKPVRTEEHREWLSYDFTDRANNHTIVEMHWEKVKVPFKIDIDVHKIAVESFKKQLSSSAAFTSEGPMNAAKYCLENGVYLDEAMAWIDKSIGAKKSYSSLQIKSGLLEKQGKTAESETVMREAVELAGAGELFVHANGLLNQGKNAEALTIAKMNVKKYPQNWQSHFSLAIVHEKNGDKKQALKNFETAKANATDENAKKQIDGRIKRLL
jgi:tetratricopeptide (TPR) repeat protein